MKAVLVSRYGAPEVLQLSEVPAPEPGPDQVVVRVRATSVNPVDWHSMRGEPVLVRFSSGLTKPRQPGIGADVAGVVEAVGSAVTTLRPGDAVFGMSIRTWAELVPVKAEGLVAKPAAVSFEEAGTIGVAALTALQGLRLHGRVQPGQRVLVAGAGGGVGHFAVQIARALGAGVTAATSTANLAWVGALGADEVIDYSKADPTAARSRFDVIFDAGGWLTLAGERRALRPGGIAVNAGAGGSPSVVGLVGRMAAAAIISRVGDRRFVSYLANRTPEDLETLRAMLEAGQLRPHIDRRYGLAEIREAVRYQETGQAQGKVAVSIAGG
ncbi:MAG: NAD(P)-dependent alcohol dehydrogenase [Chloroflexi bacterium]|nr:NAD(P)-dependent alcohol dehydrogenase [Chloroflexota bacterium]